MSRPVAIVIPMEEELRPLLEAIPGISRTDRLAPWEAWQGSIGACPVVLVLSDCGPANAAAATERAISVVAPVAVLCGGSAGAHDPELLPGDVVVGDRYCVLHQPAEQEQRRMLGLHPKQIRFRRDGRRIHQASCEGEPRLVALAAGIATDVLAEIGPWSGPGWPDGVERRRGKLVVGGIGSRDGWTVRREEIAAFRSLYGAVCEDMESAYVAQICELHRVPFVAVRGIADNEAVARLPRELVDKAVAEAGARAATVLAMLAARA